MEAGSVVGLVVGILAAVGLIFMVYNSIILVREREAVIIERCGKFSKMLVPGCYCILYPIDAPKRFTHRFHADVGRGVQLIERVNQSRVSTQREVLDFPKQTVITRDGARIQLDAILQFRITSPKTTMYSTINLPLMLSKLLQSQVRNVAASLEVDQLIESSAAVARLRGEMSVVATKWGIEIQDTRLQEVHAGDLRDALEQHKSADLANQGIMISARSEKQTAILEGESIRDRRIREAEGEAANVRANAKGQARAIVNRARAEAESIAEIGRALGTTRGEAMARYLLAVKYMEALRAILSHPDTTVRFLPHSSAPLQSLQALGLNTVVPPAPSS